MADGGIRQVTTATFLLLTLLGGLTASTAQTPLWQVLVLALVLAIGQQVPVPSLSGEKLFVGIGIAVFMPLLLQLPEGGFDLYGIVAIYSLGLALSWLGFLVSRDERRSIASYFVSEVLGLVAFTTLFLIVATTIGADAADAHSMLLLVAVTAGCGAWYVTRGAVRALISLERHEPAIRYTWLLALADWPVVVGLFAAGALFGFTWPAMGAWALGVALMPYAFVHVAFLRYDGTRRTYRQSIRALARIPEVAGLTADGHAVRTAELALAMGRELGMHPSNVEELEYAALMHDIGRVTLNEPAILKAGYTAEDIARWGSQIIAEAPYLRRVARIVRTQHDPYRRPGVDRDPDIPLASKIIKVASDYDRAIHERRLPPMEALEHLHRGSAYEYDPEVTASLRRVLAHQQVIAA